MINDCRYFVCSVNNSRNVIILNTLLSKLFRFLACTLAYFPLTGKKLQQCIKILSNFCISLKKKKKKMGQIHFLTAGGAYGIEEIGFFPR